MQVSLASLRWLHRFSPKRTESKILIIRPCSFLQMLAHCKNSRMISGQNIEMRDNVRKMRTRSTKNRGTVMVSLFCCLYGSGDVTDEISLDHVYVGGSSMHRSVEMRGVEPLSENTSAGLSPSAFRGLISTEKPSTERLLTV